MNTIVLKLDKEDLIRMVIGTSPSFESMNKKPGNFGYLNGSYMSWHWDTDKLRQLNNEQLLELYIICKKDWLDASKRQSFPEIIDTESTRMSLLQYENLRKHFQKLIKDVLGPDYYNMGMDVYTCDEFACQDLKSKLKG